MIITAKPPKKWLDDNVAFYFSCFQTRSDLVVSLPNLHGTTELMTQSIPGCTENTWQSWRQGVVGPKPRLCGENDASLPLSRTARYSKRSSLHITHDSPKYPDVSMGFPRYIHQHPLETPPFNMVFCPESLKR